MKESRRREDVESLFHEEKEIAGEQKRAEEG